MILKTVTKTVTHLCNEHNTLGAKPNMQQTLIANF